MPNESSYLEILTAIGAVFSGVAAIIITVFTAASTKISHQLYKMNAEQQREAWIKVYTEMHQAFWNDPVMMRVRCWLNYDLAYADLKPTLIKRKEIFETHGRNESLSESEYRQLDDLDKFYNWALEMNALNSRLKVSFDQNYWKSVYLDYWVHRCESPGREELKWYVETFYPDLLNSTLPVGQTWMSRGGTWEFGQQRSVNK